MLIPSPNTEKQQALPSKVETTEADSYDWKPRGSTKKKNENSYWKLSGSRSIKKYRNEKAKNATEAEDLDLVGS